MNFFLYLTWKFKYINLTYAIPNFLCVGGAGLLLRNGGPNDWVNTDMEYSINVINFHECGETKYNRRISDN